ncbi:hypothetical protein AAH995_28780, partial [Pseudomonas putida]
SRKKSGAQHRASGGRLECGDDGSLTVEVLWQFDVLWCYLQCLLMEGTRMLIVGVVEKMNLDRVAIWVEEHGGYTIIKMPSPARIEQGDVMCWPDRYSTGSCTYWNATKGWDAEVLVQHHDVPIDLLSQQFSA